MLKDFCIESYSELKKMRELPRPPFDSPLIAGNLSLTHPLSKLSSYQQLHNYITKSSISNNLQGIGHQWYWHYEVFEWLFLEYMLSQSYTNDFDTNTFNKTFNRANAELSRNHFIIRRITVLNGLPKLNTTINIRNGLSLSAVKDPSYDLARLLKRHIHNKNREPSLWVMPEDHLLIQDCVVQKGNDGKELLRLREQNAIETDIVVKTLKLCIDTPICPKAVYSTYLSGFPLLPISHTEFDEYSEVTFTIQRNLTRSERVNIHKTLDFIRNMKEPEYFSTALNRFSDSYRVRNIEQNIVDLIVALEAMMGVKSEELKRRLATNVAFLLGINDSQRNDIYKMVSIAYDIRSTIVHGTKNQAQNVRSRLENYFPELKGKPSGETNNFLNQFIRKLQVIVRAVLNAYIYGRLRKPPIQWFSKEEDYQFLPFDSKQRSEIQRTLGIKR
ncbi:MAG: HEPN domain-containing protein [Dehalococcoidales bacterium]|nr:HEPN domain-containing protein [Dehalococcoidales bacterium]